MKIALINKRKFHVQSVKLELVSTKVQKKKTKTDIKSVRRQMLHIVRRIFPGIFGTSNR